MKEPSIKIGFIIFNSQWKSEIKWNNGHRKSAMEWIRNNNFTKLYNSVVGKNNIFDEEDFLIEYIGAVKLYAYMGQFYCRIPRMIDEEKTYLKKYFKEKGYIIIGDCVYEEKNIKKVKEYKYSYNQTLIPSNKPGEIYCYNPDIDGD